MDGQIDKLQKKQVFDGDVVQIRLRTASNNQHFYHFNSTLEMAMSD